MSRKTTPFSGRLLQGSRQPGTAPLLSPSGQLRCWAKCRVWAYIKTNNLQNPQNRREILADAKLEPVFGAK